MAQARLDMKKLKEVLRLHLVGGVASRRQLARVVGCSKTATAVSDCLRRAERLGGDRGAGRGGVGKAPFSRANCSAERDGSAGIFPRRKVVLRSA